MIPILVLAADKTVPPGGTDPLLRETNGVPLLVHICRQAIATDHPVFAAIPGPSHPRYHALRDEHIACFDVPEALHGPGGMLRGAVRRLPPCDGFMLLPAGASDVSTSGILSLISGFKSTQASAVAMYQQSPGDNHPSPIIISSAHKDAFERIDNSVDLPALSRALRIDLVKIIATDDNSTVHSAIETKAKYQV